MAATLDRYKSCYPHLPDTPDLRPTADQVIADQGLAGKWTDKKIVITGATSGIGLASAKSLQETGAKLYLTARDAQKAKGLKEDVFADAENVEVMTLELDSLQSCKEFAEELKKKTDKVNILLCNAGIMAAPFQLTKDGYESQFAVDHLSHYAIFRLLEPLLKAAATKEFASRVVTVSSAAHRIASVRLDDINFSNGEKYNEWAAYGQAKTANIMMATQIDRLYGSKGIHANSLMPGSIFTPLQRYQPTMNADNPAYQVPEVKASLKTPEQGAATSVWACTAKELEGVGGKYLEDTQVGEITYSNAPRGPGYAEHAFNEENEQKLWDLSESILKEKNIL